ncbi:hypothetical protein AVEN_26938-1 [Araneus ventricosus]|uniref:HAT C-terminal dimerisation domain-containing protein n=1 Tax=Araneus ventricosus TaxID=182803 RepID=A0A4Y2TU13_ARAVE|nr:hypothetical protein AVEN_26938-1 [Araneus ventricosus]
MREKHLHLILNDGVHNDVNGFQLHQEILVTLILIPAKVTSLLEILTFLNLSNAAENFPIFLLALRIFLPVPLTIAATERIFSTLRLIENDHHDQEATSRFSNYIN